MRLKAIALLTALFFGLSLTSAVAATKSPTPTPKASVTKKAPVKKAPVKKPPVKKKKKKVAGSPSQYQESVGENNESQSPSP
jgi:hypothetical protein